MGENDILNKTKNDNPQMQYRQMHQKWLTWYGDDRQLMEDQDDHSQPGDQSRQPPRVELPEAEVHCGQASPRIPLQ